MYLFKHLMLVGVLIVFLCPELSDGVLDERHMYIVAHEDDDLLFFNPDIWKPIRQGHQVRTMYLTAGDSCRGKAYWRGRENGIKAAYASMAGVANSWTFISRYRSAHLYTLNGTASRVSVVFLRLPGGTCYANTKSLRRLWEGKVARIAALDATASYTRSGLIATVLNQVNNFLPHYLGIQDKTAQAPAGQNPYDYQLYYPECRVMMVSDHPDHIAAAFFADAVHTRYTRTHTLIRYRGYNISNEPVNLTTTDSNEKRTVFNTYRAHDPALPDPLACIYHPWILRQYIDEETTGFAAPDAPIHPR
jgi:hypothetical protein